MNKARRASISKIIAAIEAAKSDLEEIRNDEQDAMDNMPESFWESDRYMQMEEAVDNLEQALDDLDGAIDSMNEAIG